MKSDELAGSPLSDEELAACVRDGNHGLWSELVERVMRIIRPAIRAQVSRHDHWEDLEQNVLIRFWKALPAYGESRGTLKVYVRVLAQREVIDNSRAAGREPDLVDIDVLLDVAEEAACHPNPGRDLMSFVEEIVGSERARAIHMRVFEELSYAEIGQKLDRSEDAAKILVRRALQKLREYFEDRHV